MINTTDPIADMLSRIRNAILVGKDEVNVPHSNLKEEVAKILVSTGFLADAKPDADETNGRKIIKITIAVEGRPSVITQIDRLSSPGRRQYVKAKEIPMVKRGRGIVVVSTSKGVMSGEEARQKGLGGELICEVY